MAKKPSNRVRSNAVLYPISGWGEADEHLKTIGDLQLQIQQAEADATQQINVIKAELKTTTESITADIKLHVKSLQAFCANHQDDFGKARSRQLQFGVVGWRASTAIKICQDAVDRLKTVFGKKAEPYIRVKEEADKEALAKLTDEQLAAVGCKRENRDVFYAEPDVPQAVDYGDSKP
ncbi:MAG: host-nuclease inhibitor Gam family protein [Planctomycetaceae bacterium]|nr:host-nuclease inhibitor Gam family protein [Planctomycetaceae bacterium]